MKKPIASLLAVNLRLEGRTLHLAMHAMRSILIISAASLLFSCMSGNAQNEPIQATAPSLSLSAPAAAPAIQCSDDATIAAGSYHTVGLNRNKTVVAVGDNTYGQLNVSSWTNIKAISAGVYHTVGLNEDGTVVAAGNYDVGQLNVSSWTNMKAIAAGAYHTVGLKEDGYVVATGYDFGQLDVASWTNITAIAAGVYHTVGLHVDGTVVAVGNNDSGQLEVSSWTNIKAIAAGAYYTVGLKDDGTVVAVGDNMYGQLNVSSWTNMRAIAAGANHTVGLKEDGTVVAVGNNESNQLNVSSLFTSIMPICCPAPLDVTPPMTTTLVTGTMGINGKYVSDVQMTLLATDNDGGTGVKEIHYSIDGNAAIVSGCSTSYSIVSDGTHTVRFFALDNEGNAEAEQVMTINIHKAESSDLDEDSACLWPPNHKMVNVKIRGWATRFGSEIDSIIVKLEDKYGIHKMPPLHGFEHDGFEHDSFEHAIPIESWRSSDEDKDDRSYTVTIEVTDKAGHQTKKTKKVRVLPDGRR